MILASLSPTLIELVLALSVMAPEVTAVTPDPLPVGGTGQVAGSDFVDQATSIQIGGVVQRVVNIQPTQVTFVVDATTPEGAQTLTLTTPSGMVNHALTIAPPDPVIDSLSPDPFVLGQRATLQGGSLDTVTAVTLGGESATISEQTEFLLQFDVPFEGSLVGPQQLVLVSPTGGVTAAVVVVAPRPEIDAISPNPVRRGELITIRGQIAAVNVVTVSIGQVDAPVVQVGPTAVTAFVPLTTTLGPQDVTVSVAQQASAPEGPLLVQREDPALPKVDGVYPSSVAADGLLWVVGSNLDGVTGATHGLEVVACERRACRLTLGSGGSAPVGVPFTAAVTGPAGGAIFSLQLLDEAAVIPVVEAVAPRPAFRGEALTITGMALGDVRSVLIGGRTQRITDFDASQVVVEVALDTPLGAEQLFISGNSGSLPVTVTVLDPLPGEDTGADTTGGDASETDTGSSLGETSASCTTASEAVSSWLLLLFAAWLVRATWRRTSARAA